MWWVLATAARGQATGPDGAPLVGELLDTAPLGAGERPAAVGPRRALDLETRALLLLTEAGAAPDPTALLARRRRLLEAALKVRRTNLGPEDPVAEQVAVAWLLEDLGRTDEAGVVWAEVLAREPAGAFAGWAELALAERDLTAGDVSGARARFEAAAADPRLAAYARYRAAWCAWTEGAPEAAALGFHAVATGGDARLSSAARADLLALVASLPAEAAEGVLATVCAGDEGCLAAARAELAGR